MPQLDISTFSSQIFWVLVGFFLVYIFMATVVNPALRETLDNRVAHIDGLLKEAEKLRSEANKLEHEAFSAFEDAQIQAAAEESKLVENFRQDSIKEKEKLYDLFVEESRKEAESLAESSAKTYAEISENMDDLVAYAMDKVSCSMEKTS